LKGFFRRSRHSEIIPNQQSRRCGSSLVIRSGIGLFITDLTPTPLPGERGYNVTDFKSPSPPGEGDLGGEVEKIH